MTRRQAKLFRRVATAGCRQHASSSAQLPVLAIAQRRADRHGLTMHRNVISYFCLVAAVVSTTSSATSIHTGPFWVQFMPENVEMQRESVTALQSIRDALGAFPGYSLYLCATSGSEQLRSQRRDIVRRALERRGIRPNRIVEGSRCGEDVTGRSSANAPHEAVFIAMGPRADITRLASAVSHQ
jgi:hypothetical protein